MRINKVIRRDNRIQVVDQLTAFVIVHAFDGLRMIAEE